MGLFQQFNNLMHHLKHFENHYYIIIIIIIIIITVASFLPCNHPKEFNSDKFFMAK